MSALYSVHIGRVDGATVAMDVTQIHPDAGPPPEGPTFPVNLLLDVWKKLDDGWSSFSLIQAPAIAPDAAKELAGRQPWGPVFGRLRDLRDGVEIAITKDEYSALPGHDATWQGKRVIARRTESKRRTNRESGDDPATRSRIDALLASNDPDAVGARRRRASRSPAPRAPHFSAGVEKSAVALPTDSAEQPKKCVDVRSPPGSDNGTPVQVWDCAGAILGTDGVPQQTWSLLDDGTVRGLNGKCLDVRGGDTTDGTAVQIWDCADVPQQRWARTAAGELRGIGDKCLGISGTSTDNGTGLEIRTCSGDLRQKLSTSGLRNPTKHISERRHGMRGSRA